MTRKRRIQLIGIKTRKNEVLEVFWDIENKYGCK